MSFLYPDFEHAVPVQSVGVDCLGSAWCAGAELKAFSGEGTGQVWGSLRAPGDGLLRLSTGPGQPRRHDRSVFPHVGTDQLAPGSTFKFSARTSGGAQTSSAMLSSVFASVPAIASYDDGTGAVHPAYPAPVGTSGTASHSALLHSTALRLTFWRPQRVAIRGAEAGRWVDMGTLGYSVSVNGDVKCPLDSLSNLSSTLEPVARTANGVSGVLTDTAADAPMNPANTMSFRLDVARCLQETGRVLQPGQPLRLGLTAEDNAGDTASEFFHFRIAS